MKKVHFLHIPKTAGQSVHRLLCDSFSSISPIRLNSQFNEYGVKAVTDYDVISGHIDWELMLKGGEADYSFTVLRDPVERILSFYYYLRREAKKLSDKELELPHNTGMKRVLLESPNLYFCPNDRMFRDFINNHYDNFYSYFFASKKYSGYVELSNMTQHEVLGKAVSNMSHLDAIFTLDSLHKLKKDLEDKFSIEIESDISQINIGDGASANERLLGLEDVGKSDLAQERIMEMCELDNKIFNFVSKVK